MRQVVGSDAVIFREAVLSRRTMTGLGVGVGSRFKFKSYLYFLLAMS